ncbi:unnamed protein product [Orchesella dallaii]|uniref:Uncharacterized protein n=1 Tax=Orchesella dallaii TaxID=48710 RepID=A0ABP1Q5H4_9HEXA
MSTTPKSRSTSSPVTSPKKSKKQLQTSAPEDNGENDGENDGRLSPQDSGDRVIDSIATSSDEDMEPEPGSEVDISDTDLPKVKEENGIVDCPMKKTLVWWKDGLDFINGWDQNRNFL